jgi:hypothetical protein
VTVRGKNETANIGYSDTVYWSSEHEQLTTFSLLQYWYMYATMTIVIGIRVLYNINANYTFNDLITQYGLNAALQIVPYSSAHFQLKFILKRISRLQLLLLLFFDTMVLGSTHC